MTLWEASYTTRERRPLARSKTAQFVDVRSKTVTRSEAVGGSLRKPARTCVP